MASRQDFPTATVAKRVRELRRQRDFTAEQLADRMQQEGVPFDKTVIANLETGRRRFVTVQELFALASALNVPPVHLLVSPDSEPDAPYQVTPAVSASAAYVRLFITGRCPLPGMDAWKYFSEVPAAERMSDEDLTRAVSLHRAGMRPVTRSDVADTGRAVATGDQEADHAD